MKYLILSLGVVFINLNISQAQVNYDGGDGGGADLEVQYGIANYSYRGGNNSGYKEIQKCGLANYSYRGGYDDGYDFVLYRTPFIWTGTVGTSWTVAGNWNYNLIPGIYRPVIIPDGVPNWPYVNAGLFNIGDNPNNGAFKCASLWVQDGALLVTRINNRIENYGLITIDGTIQVKGTILGAFQNREGGVVIINSGGELKIKP